MTVLRAIATYLPQFHPTPENDLWWGAGFTEWTNARRGRPLFPGHAQPRRPGELGYYDLMDPAIRTAQAELAAAYGIDAFCYFHYWFGGGRRILHDVLDEVLRLGEPDFPFCLAWANETWTRRWDGGVNDILIEQLYSAEDDRAHGAHLARIFADPRYFRVDGRPLFLIYRSADMPDVSATLEIFREAAAQAGVGDPFFVRFETGHKWGQWPGDPRISGFDAALEYPPFSVRRDGHLNDRLLLGVPLEQISIFDYAAAAASALARPRPDYPQIPGVMLGFDNSARRGFNGSWIFHGVAPELYGLWLEAACAHAIGTLPGDQRLVFINAWNEWGESCHLEPDAAAGLSYLETTRLAIDQARAGAALIDDLDAHAQASLRAAYARNASLGYHHLLCPAP